MALREQSIVQFDPTVLSPVGQTRVIDRVNVMTPARTCRAAACSISFIPISGYNTSGTSDMALWCTMS